jgi:predicted dehydrogenase
MKRYGAGIIGLGVGEQHAAGFHRQPGCAVVALCDTSEDKLERVAAGYPGARRTARWHDLIEDTGVNLISVASFDDAHAEQTVAALDSGKHVFVEKPLCRSAAELQRIKTALASHPQLVLASNLVLRAAPVYRWLRDAIRAGELGEIYAFDGDYLFGRIEKITDGWRKHIDEYSVMLGGGIHLADLMLWLTGQKPRRASAHVNRICTQGTGFDAHDFVSATYLFDSSLVGRITANFGCVHRHQHVVRVFGTKATFLLDDMGPRLHESRSPSQPSRTLQLSTLPASKWDLIPDFLECVSAQRGGPTHAQPEFDTISVCLAADQAIRAKTTVEINYQ